MEAKVLAWLEEQAVVAKGVVCEDSAVVGEMRASLEAADGREWLVGGVDVSPSSVASMAVYALPSLVCVEEVRLEVTLKEPYVAGFLAFREAEAYASLLRRCRARPHVLLVDGNGVLHPRSAGSACHVGVKNSIATIGVAKELLCVDGLTKKEIKEKYLGELRERGQWLPLKGTQRTLGAVLRLSSSSPFKPVFVSVGHDLCLDTAVFLTKFCSPIYRIPQPIRHADHLGRSSGGKK